MEIEELKENAEHAHEKGQRGIGLTMAVVAVLLAVATMLSHRAHTEEVLLQTKVADQWAFYQAKNGRSHMYAADAQLAGAIGSNGAALAEDFKKQAEKQDKDAEGLREQAQDLERESAGITHKANYFDGSELFLEISIVLCSIALLTESGLFWKLSFLSTVSGVVLIAFGLISR